MKLAGLVLSLFASQLLFGCMGIVYNHTTQPLTLDMHATPVVDETSRGDVKTFQYYVQVKWHKNGIGEIAKEYGFDEVYYADVETLRIFSIWTQQWVHVYGTRKVAASAETTP